MSKEEKTAPKQTGVAAPARPQPRQTDRGHVPPDRFRFLHLCCGKCRIEGAVNVDKMEACHGYAGILADAEQLPFADHSFDICLIDPPYSSQEDSSRYGVPRLVSPRKVFAQLARLLVPGGCASTKNSPPSPSGISSYAGWLGHGCWPCTAGWLGSPWTCRQLGAARW